MFFEQCYDKKLAQYAYLIGCQKTGEAVVIDPMRDIDQYYEVAEREGLTIVGAFDTHIHADFLSGLREFAEKGVTVYASDEGDEDWKYEWLFDSDYSYRLLTDGDEVNVGNVTIKAVYTPGHTPEHLSYLVTDGAAADEPMGMATGDFVFVGDVGRPDLLESAAGIEGVMESSARKLYSSVEEFKSLPDYLQIWPGHGAGSACGKALGAVPESTVGYEKRFNPSIIASKTENQFVKFILDGQPEPPLYFKRMKRQNKEGPPVLNGRLPEPRRIFADDLHALSGNENAVVLDTREQDEFAGGFLPGSLLSTYNSQFNTVAGSYINEDEPIYLIIEESRLKQAIRDLVRIGLDKIEGYATPRSLHRYHEEGEGMLNRLPVLKFKEVKQHHDDPNRRVLDVRKRSEYREGHLPDAINKAHTRLLETRRNLNKGLTYMVHCQSGSRAAVAAAMLKRDGFNVEWVDDQFGSIDQEELERPVEEQS